MEEDDVQRREAAQPGERRQVRFLRASARTRRNGGRACGAAILYLLRDGNGGCLYGLN
jgi:hypothetical protein